MPGTAQLLCSGATRPLQPLLFGRRQQRRRPAARAPARWPDRQPALARARNATSAIGRCCFAALRVSTRARFRRASRRRPHTHTAPHLVLLLSVAPAMAVVGVLLVPALRVEHALQARRRACAHLSGGRKSRIFVPATRWRAGIAGTPRLGGARTHSPASACSRVAGARQALGTGAGAAARAARAQRGLTQGARAVCCAGGRPRARRGVYTGQPSPMYVLRASVTPLRGLEEDIGQPYRPVDRQNSPTGLVGCV